ncbi:MAG TPA: helix-hairpin-helix domain-containing protein [Planctomycetota bacterium]|nr:helix-hairpin-helix domain-containing protein [Planctomycetota bacterium]
MPADDTSKETKAQRREYLVIYVLCVVLLAMLAALWLRQRGYFRSAPVVEHHGESVVEKPIELNTARWWELTLIHGIGEVRAREIIALRDRKLREQKDKKQEEVGFTSLDELTEVRGITPEIIERMREKIRVEPLKPAGRRSGGGP